MTKQDDLPVIATRCEWARDVMYFEKGETLPNFEDDQPQEVMQLVAKCDAVTLLQAKDAEIERLQADLVVAKTAPGTSTACKKPDSNSLVGSLVWNKTMYCEEEDALYTVHLTEGGRLTVLHRKTGYEDGHYDTESGYRDAADKFWLASGDRDVRRHEGFTVQQAIDWIKANANTCVAA